MTVQATQNPFFLPQPLATCNTSKFILDSPHQREKSFQAADTETVTIHRLSQTPS